MLAVVDLNKAQSLAHAEAVRLAKQRWQTKIMQAVSNSVNCAYIDDDPAKSSAAMLRHYERLNFLAGRMAEALVTAFINEGQTLEPRPDKTPSAEVGSVTAYISGVCR